MTEEQIKRITELVLQDVCELPDRTSPDDQPEMMLVTGDELATILENALTAEETDARAEAWKRLWKEERARYEALIERAFQSVGKTPNEIAELVIGEWCRAGDRRNVRDHVVRTAEILALGSALSSGESQPSDPAAYVEENPDGGLGRRNLTNLPEAENP